MTTDDDLVSIVMPAYNASKFIQFAVESVINQTHINWELVVVDDGSTDNTSEVVEQFCRNRKNIRTFRTKNSGVSKARNFGFEQTNSSSNFIYFMDADDTIADTFLEKCLKILKLTKSKVVFCDYLEIDENGREVIDTNKFENYYFSINGVSRITEPYQIVFLETIYVGSVIAESTTVMDYNVFRQSKGWNENLVFAEGKMLFFELILRTQFVFLNEKLYSYRRYNNQCTKAIPETTRLHNSNIVFENLEKFASLNIMWKAEVFIAKRFEYCLKRKYLINFYIFNKNNLSMYSLVKIIIKNIYYYFMGFYYCWYLFNLFFRRIGVYMPFYARR